MARRSCSSCSPSRVSSRLSSLVAAIGIPILFQLYVIEVGPYEEDVVVPTFVTLVVGVGLGIGWAEIAGPVRAARAVPVLHPSLTNGTAHSSGGDRAAHRPVAHVRPAPLAAFRGGIRSNPWMVS